MAAPAPSAQARQTLQQAFDRFAATVTPDDHRLFHNTQLKDVRDEALSIERRLRARRMQKNMARLDPFLRGMEHYSKVVEVLCNGTPYLSWIWAPVKLMLMITMDSISAFEKLIEAYGKIADMLPRLDRLAKALADDHNFQNVLALVYSDIIEFHQRAYKFVRRKSWATFFGSMWAGFESRFNGILERLAYHSKLVDKEATAADIAEAIRRNKADDKKWEQQEREWAAPTYSSGTSEVTCQAAATGSYNTKQRSYGLGMVQKITFCGFAENQARKHQDLAVYVHDVYFKSYPLPTKKALLSLLPELLRGLGSVRLVVDGVDEWVAQDQKELLQDLSKMVSTDQSSHVCKIMVASQDTMDIARSLRKKDRSATTISLNNRDERLAVDSAIAKFVDSKLQDAPDHFDEVDPDASILNHIKQTLLKNSHGMFLWVSLVLESMNTVYSPEELRTIVDDLPSDLEALYERILVRLCSAPGAQSHGGVSRIMSWVCFAQRPLHKSELLHALSILPHDTLSKVRSVPVASILDHCKPLIEELPDSTIVPVHFSVKRYFLTSRIPQIVPAIDATRDLSSVCAIVITRALNLLLLDKNSTDYLCHLVSGKYRLLAYALEFWIEHCLQHAFERGSLGTDQPLQHHLAQMHEKHMEVCNAVQRTSTPVRTQDANDLNHKDDRLEAFSNMPIHGLMIDVLRLRRLTSQLDGEKASDIDTYVIANDQTLFSKLAQKHESAVVRLLGKDEVEGISSTILRAFQDSYASTAFRCRFPHCNRLSSGFATAELRRKHETTHIQRVYCQTVSCQYSRIGFAKRSLLNAHMRTHHGQPNLLNIPKQIRQSATLNQVQHNQGVKRPNEDTIDSSANTTPQAPVMAFPKTQEASNNGMPNGFAPGQPNEGQPSADAGPQGPIDPQPGPMPTQQANRQPLTEQVRMSMMPPELDNSIKRQLLRVPEHQFRVILQSYMTNLRRNNGMPDGSAPGHPNASQPPPGAGPIDPQRGPLPTQQQRVAAAANLLRANPGIITTTDPKPFPPNILNARIRQDLPPDVRTWQQLKGWAAQNPALVPGVDSQKLIMLQVLHFQDAVRQSNGVKSVPDIEPRPYMKQFTAQDRPSKTADLNPTRS
ncbi:hypothetical protein yc1106_09521 [Curvularia clavata]|uniref:DUF7708 domain-containing protein n=1 Tax=Curvularia clavata TaxID=95742 RepID=A0A9Q8ZHV3_CURCL|nr:hypothetical protein yc1106_09521 [Curvularia clavata]